MPFEIAFIKLDPIMGQFFNYISFLAHFRSIFGSKTGNISVFYDFYPCFQVGTLLAIYIGTKEKTQH